MTPRRLGIVLAMVLLAALLVAWALVQVDAPRSTLDRTTAPVAAPTNKAVVTRSNTAPAPPPIAAADELRGPNARAATPPPVSAPAPAAGEPPPERDPPVARIDAGVVIFQLNKAGIAGAIQFKLSDMAGCYDAWLEQDPTLQGNMVVGFRIVADDAGTSIVDQVQIIDGGLGQRAMDGCVLNVFQDLRFEHADQPIEVHYPLTFSSSPDAG